MVALLSLALIGSCIFAASVPNKNLIQWEKDLAFRKAQEKIRELEWERQMKEKRKDERVRERQWHLDQAARERLGLFWDQPTAGRCISHGVRDYSARLLNATPYHYNWLEPCMDIPIDIQGKPRNASRCEQKGDVGSIVQLQTATCAD
ncbi:hypothetical protein HWV62_18516 [Athelia sp. TMB]|nr:hypothetical protein HWV62_18516 [Athelia sp. TMB]